MIRLWRRDHPDQGGIAVITAIVVASGLLLGVGALVIDAGLMLAEREELQTGADAAAVRVAQECASVPASCGGALGQSLAADYANRNASDGAAGVTLVCGRGGLLAPCSQPAPGRSDCVGPAPRSGNYAEVRIHTRLPNGGTLLPPAFGAAVVDGYDGVTIRTCARAAWGAPSTASLSVTLSACEWLSYTQGGNSFPQPPTDKVIYLHASRDTGVCQPAGPSGADAPGGFGWLDDGSDNGCETPVATDGTYPADPGNGIPRQCEAVLTRLRDSAQPTLIPVFRSVSGTGENTAYTLLGFAAFVVTGWHLPGFTQPSTLTGREPCKQSDSCLSGYFTRALVAAPGPVGGPDLGAVVVTLVG